MRRALAIDYRIAFSNIIISDFQFFLNEKE